jgi:beta-aspartyl-peptidase (threonine type)
VGDSPLIGCGCYADLETGGVSCTGYGEAIMKVVMAKSATDFLHAMESGGGGAAENSMLAARKAVELLAARTSGTGGLILLDRYGQPGFAFNTPRMAYGYVQSDGTFTMAV